MTFPIGWIPVINQESEPVPPYAVVEAKGFDTDSGLLKIGKPSSAGNAAVFFNSGVPIPPPDAKNPSANRGQVHQTFPSPAAYQADNASAVDPAHGDTWGTQSGSWYLHKDEAGFLVLGPGSYGVCNVIRDNVTEGPAGAGAASLTFATTTYLPTCTYANGTSGEGATLTGTSNGALSVDGVAVDDGDTVLVKNQADWSQHGSYDVTQKGSGSTPFILTRRVDNDTTGEFVGVVYHIGAKGNTNKNTEWRCTNITAPTVGSQDITIAPLNFVTGASAYGSTSGHIRAASESSSSTAGDARGIASVDFQQLRALSWQAATGNYSVISGGRDNSATINYSAVGGGYQNESTGFIGSGSRNEGYAIVCGEDNYAAAYAFVGAGASNSASGGTSFIGSGYSNTSSAIYSGVVCGRNNVASAEAAIVLGGEYNQATTFSSVASGTYAKTRRLCERAHSSFPASLGKSQHVLNTLGQKSNDGSAWRLYIDASFTLGSGAEHVTIPSGYAMAGTINIFGIRSDGSSAAHYIRKFAIANVGGTTALLGTVTTIGTDHEDDAAYDVTITADNTNDCLKIECTGKTGETIRWIAVVDAVEIEIGS